MATIRSVLGVIEGSAGSLTFSSTNGKNIMRQKVGKNTSNTVAQQTQRHKFAQLALQYKKLVAVAALGFKKLGALSPYNRFVQTNDPYTSVDQDLVASIDYAQMSISAGGVLGAADLTVTANGAGAAVYDWTSNANGGSGLATDKAKLVVVNMATGETYSNTYTRADASGTVGAVGLTQATKGNYAAYLYFTRADDSDASPSAYHAIN